MKIYTFFIFLLITSASNAQVGTLFEREASYHHFNGTALVIENGQTKYQGNFGYANVKEQLPVNDTTVFDIGSLTKQFTAAGILHLMAEGKIQLQDKINDHLGVYSNKKWKKVTVHQLLTHTSGIPSVYQTEQGLDIFFAETKPIALNELISKFSYGKLLFSPGEEFSYSNSGYILLAAIIEQISGSTFEEYLEENIFERYGLRNTSFNPIHNTALPYYGYLPEDLLEAPVFHRSWLKGAGGVYSTTVDLSKWVSLILSNDFLTPELRDLFLKSHIQTGGGSAYGYGWQFQSNGIIEHDGGNDGFISFLSFDPQTGDHHVLLTNRSFKNLKLFGKSAEEIRTISNKVWQIKAGEDVELHPEITNHSFSDTVLKLNQTTFRLTSKNDGYYTMIEGGNLTQLLANTPIDGASELNNKVLKISKHLEKNQYWRFASYSNGEMKFVAYSGLFRFGFGQIKKKAGKDYTLIPFLATPEYALVRVKGDKGSQHFIIYFNEEGKVMGVYDREFYEPETSFSIRSYPIGNNKLFVDGFPYGSNSMELTINGNELLVQQLGRTVTLK